MKLMKHWTDVCDINPLFFFHWVLLKRGLILIRLREDCCI